AVHRIALPENVLGQLGVDDRDVRVRGILEVCERTARLNPPTFDLRPVGVPAADLNGGEAMALEVDVRPGTLVDDDDGDGGTLGGSGDSALITKVKRIPATIPKVAPTVAMAVDSARNWRNTSARRAPSDFRSPISRVRSATAMSMMFMITIPPITSDTITMPGMTVTRILLMPAQKRWTPSDVSSTKSLSCLGRRWRRLRMIPSACEIA